jgi:hypothetical protein
MNDYLFLAKWILIITVLSTFVVETAFIQLTAAKGLAKRKMLMREFKWQSYLWFLVGYPADFVFNMTRGMLMFRTLSPHGFFFSERIDFYMRHPERCAKVDRAVLWAGLLNQLDPGHTYWPMWAQQRLRELTL